MASFGKRFCWTLGIVAVVAFSFVADDLNEWLYRHRTIEQLKSDGAPPGESARDKNRPLARNPADGAVQSNPRAEASREAQAAVAHAPAEKSGIAPVANVEKPADSAVADAGGKSANLAAAEQTSNVLGQAEAAKAEVIAKAPLQPLDQAPAEVSHRGASPDAPVDSAAGEAAAKSADLAAAEQTSDLRGQEAEAAQKDVTAAKAPSQPPGDAPVGAIGQAQTGTDRGLQLKACEGLDAAQLKECVDQLSRLELQLRALQADGADRWLLRGQEAEAAKAEVIAKAPLQPLDQAPAEVSHRGASPDAPVDSAVADAGGKSADLAAAEQTSNVLGQAEAAKAEVIAKAPLQPLDQAPAEVSHRGASPDAPVDSAVADAGGKSADLAAAEQTSNVLGQAEAAKAEVIAKAPLQPLDQAPAEVSHRGASPDAPVDSAAGEAAAKSADLAAAEQTSDLRGQEAEAAQKDVTAAKAPSQPPGDAPVGAIGQAQTGTDRGLQLKACEGLDAAQLKECVDQLSRLELQLRALQADGADRWLLRGQEAEAAKAEVIAKAPLQPLDQAPAEVSHRGASPDAPVDSAVADAGGKSADLAAAEQTSNVLGQAEAAKAEVIAKAPLQPLDQAPAEVSHRGASPDAPVDSAVADAGGKSADLAAAEQTSNVLGQAEAAKAEVIAKAPLQPLDQAPAEVSHRGASPDAPVDSAAGEAAAKSADLAAAEQTSDLRGQEAEAAQKDVTAAKAPSQPPGDAPVGAIGQAQTGTDRGLQLKACEGLDAAQLKECVDQLSRLELQLRALQADGADRWLLRGQEAEAAKAEVIAKAPLQPLDQAPAEVSHRGASPDAPVDSAVADAGGKSADLAAAEQTSNVLGQAEAAKAEVIAKAPLQPLDQAPAEVSHRGASPDAPVDSAAGEAAAKSADLAAAEQTSDLRGQEAEAAQKDVTAAKAPSQPPGDAPVGAIGQAQTGTDRGLQLKACEGLDAAQLKECVDQLSRLELQLRALQADGADRWLLRGQEAEAAKAEVIAKAPLQPLDQAPAEVSHRGASPDAPVDSAVADAGGKSADLAAAEQTSNVLGQAEAAKAEVIAKAPLQPLDQAPAEVSHRGASPDAPVDSAVADAGGKSADLAAAEQTSNVLGQAEAAKAEVIAKAPLQPLDQAPAEALAAGGADLWVISETTSPVDYSTVVTASIFLQSESSRLKLSIYCRRGRTDLELGGDFSDIAVVGNVRDIVVTQSINRDAFIEQRWDARGSVAHFRGDAVAFLRSLPQGGELAMRVSDGKSLLLEGRLALDGLNRVRERFASACKWREAAVAPVVNVYTEPSSSPDRMNNRILRPALGDLISISRSKGGVKAGQHAKVQRQIHKDTAKFRLGQANSKHLRKPRPYERRIVRGTPRLDEFLLFDDWD